MKKEYDFSKGKRGPVIPPMPNKTRITIRLDNDIINYFKNKVHFIFFIFFKILFKYFYKDIPILFNFHYFLSQLSTSKGSSLNFILQKIPVFQILFCLNISLTTLTSKSKR